MFVFVFLFSQGEIYGRLQWNIFKQITESASWFSRFNGCAYADLFFFLFCLCCLSHLLFKFSQHRNKKKSQFHSDMLLFHNFYPLIQNMLWNPWHSLSGWHVFHARDGQFLTIKSEGRSLPPHFDCLTETQVFFVVWPIKAFVSGGGKGGCVVLSVATPAADMSDFWSAAPNKENSTSHV